jgi:iron complex outermembrane receptor protein
MSSGGLRDERILSREIGYVAEMPEWRLSGDIRLFSDQVERLIVLTPTRPVVTFTNNLTWDYVNSTASARVHGVEASLRWRPWSGAQLQATAARTRIDSAIADSAQSDPSPLLSLLYVQSLPGELKFSAACYRVGAMKWQSSAATLDAYNTVDLRLARQFRLGGQKLDVALVTRNAMGGYTSYKPGLYDRRVSFLQLNWFY